MDDVAHVAHRLDPTTGLSWTPLQAADLPEVSGLLTAIEHLDEPVERHTLETIEAAFHQAYRPPAENALIGRDPGGQAVAYGWNYLSPGDVDVRRVYLTGGVHPGWRGRGVGRQLLEWQMSRARAHHRETWQPGFGSLRMVCFVDDHLVDRRNLYLANGFTPVRWSVDMSQQFAADLPEVQLPHDLEIVRFTPDMAEAVRQCHNRCFAEHEGAAEVGPDAWQERLGRDTFHADWSYVARVVATGEIVGYALNSGYEEDWEAQGFTEGWTDHLGVLPGWRGRGLATALLATSMTTFRRHGLEGAGLGVDFFDETRGRGLYESVGYKVAHTSIMYARTEA
ncbi:GNAT family N-acetyltransferase [Propionibacteriaceae bacterium Y2011]|uniref:GNAT family N-acetyltransferase n=1 Tax=Microlunatus sp. Y2014 TaxID=3418488 RepID=UPI003B47F232